jgi:hypothetical protein
VEAASNDDARPAWARHDRLIVTGAALVSSLAVLVATRHGVGANGTDSVAYLTMADDVASGRMPYPTVVGVPPTHLPPGWSVVVGLLVAVLPGVDALSAARIVNVVCAALLPVAVFAAVRYRSPRRTWIPALLAVVVATSYPLFELASRAVVEALFLVLLVGSLLAIDRLAVVRSTVWLYVTAASISFLTLTRFVGVVALVPLGLTILSITPGWGRRVGRCLAAGAIVLAPTVVWLLLEPGSVESSHIRGDQRAGAEQLVLSIREAGVTLVRGAFLPSVLQAVIGLALLSAPIVAVVLTSRALSPDGRGRPRSSGVVAARGLGPWLWYLLGYTMLVAFQRWSIDREIISRYWLPYWIITAVVLGRCLIAWVVDAPPVWRRAAGVASLGLIALASYNLVQVAITVRENARDGITINAVRYQQSELLDALAGAGPDVVHTDHVQLVELQLYAREALVPIERVSCRPEGLDALVEQLEAAGRAEQATAVVLVRRCRGDGYVDALVDRLDGATVATDPELGVLILPNG